MNQLEVWCRKWRIAVNGEKNFSNLSELRERSQHDVFRKTLQNNRSNKTHDRNGRESFKTDECTKKILRLEVGTEARDALKALQNITTSTNALRSHNISSQ